MRKSNWTPSIVPRGDDQDVCLVVDDLGRLGRVWREADVEATNFETVVTDLLEGQYGNPIGIFCFNPAEGWSRDVSEDIARELRRRPGRSTNACSADFGYPSLITIGSPWSARGLSGTDHGLVLDDDANASFTAAESLDQPQARALSSERAGFVRSVGRFEAWPEGFLGVSTCSRPTD